MVYSLTVQTCNLTLYFGLIIGDRFSTNCESVRYWNLLQEILCIVLLKSIPESYLSTLGELISEHHLLYKQLFKRSLKQKHHFMVHYPMIISESGPLFHNWSIEVRSSPSLIAVKFTPLFVDQELISAKL